MALHHCILYSLVHTYSMSSFYGAVVSLVALSLCDLDRIATETKTTPTDNSPSFSTTLKLTTKYVVCIFHVIFSDLILIVCH